MARLQQEMDYAYIAGLLREKAKRKPRPRLRALVMVLGDLGHSPRMQYHVASLAKEQFDVDFIGYRHSEPRAEILHNPSIDLKEIHDVPVSFRKLPRLCYLPLKIVWTVFSLIYAMFWLKKPDVILIQNPPNVPIVFCAFVANYFWQAAVILDWHNYSYTILALSMKKSGFVRTLLLNTLEQLEEISARFSDVNICVTRAMADDMLSRWKARATTLYDRAPDDFGPYESIEGRHFLFMKLGGFSPAFRTLVPTSSGTETVFTVKNLGEAATLKKDRPALLVSSTSWTEDEDFGLMFDALKLYDSRSKETAILPKLVVVVTGKGPLKNFYMEKVRQESFSNVSVTSCWLETAEYPKLLGSADLGICLHYSSSGLDLPMKVVDMFGCGIPVCAVKYKCIEELVHHNSNGLLFSSSTELCDQFCLLLADFARNQALYDLKCAVQPFRLSTWHENWKTTFQPLIGDSIKTRKKNKVDPKRRLINVCGIALAVAIIFAIFTQTF